jgi:hypothetical protein
MGTISVASSKEARDLFVEENAYKDFKLGHTGP